MKLTIFSLYSFTEKNKPKRSFEAILYRYPWYWPSVRFYFIILPLWTHLFFFQRRLDWVVQIPLIQHSRVRACQIWHVMSFIFWNICGNLHQHAYVTLIHRWSAIDIIRIPFRATLILVVYGSPSVPIFLPTMNFGGEFSSVVYNSCSGL